jgi:hypothetical protein
MNNLNRFGQSLKHTEDDTIMRGLQTSSVSPQDADARIKNWEKAFANLDELVADKMFAATGSSSPSMGSTGPTPGTQFFDASVTAIIRSYAGFFSIERGTDQPNQSLPYMNTYGVKTNELITPNIGVSKEFDEADGLFKKTETLATAKDTFTWTPDTPILPSSIKVMVDGLADADDSVVSFEATDNKKGDMMAAPGALSGNTIKYGYTDEAKVEVVLPGALKAGSRVTIQMVLDKPNHINEKIKAELEYYNATTAPVLVPYETNQVANLAAKKALGMDMKLFTTNQVTDEYTKKINKRCVDQLSLSSIGAEYEMNLKVFSIATSDFRTYLEAFLSQLKELDTKMAMKTEKGANITAYLVGHGLGDLFSKLELVTSKWVPNKDITYVDDVLGYYDGRPVVRSKHLPQNTGFGIHKTREGHLAPLMRGIFLPLTNMEEVGSFDNPLISSGGIFSYEGMDALTSDLTIEFTVNPPDQFGLKDL